MRREPNACSSPYRDGLTNAGVPVFYRHTILEALGSNAVRGAQIARLGEGGEISPATAQSLQCDLIVTSMGWTPTTELSYMAGGKSEYNDERAEILPVSNPPGIYVVGRAAGTHAVDSQMAEAQQAGSNAAAFAGFGEFDELEASLSGISEPRRTSERVCAPGKKKRFVCYCEDVTDEDVETAIAEGYDSIELLKRYSTISMGPCQGAMCSMNTIHLCARANGWTLAGDRHDDCKTAYHAGDARGFGGAKHGTCYRQPLFINGTSIMAQTLLVAGLWLRPDHYGNPAAEATCVRERVGLIDVSPLGKLQLTGPGVPELLERIYTNQWDNLRVGRVRYGVMCNDEGVVLNDGVCAHLQDETWYMTTTSTGATTVFEWLQWWLQSGWGEGIHLTDLTDTYSAFNLAGPQSRAVLEKLTDRNLTNRAFPYMRTRSAKIAEVPCQLLRLGFTGELSYEVHCPSGYALHVWEALMDAGSEFGIVPFGVEAQRILRLEKGAHYRRTGHRCDVRSAFRQYGVGGEIGQTRFFWANLP